MHRSVPFTELTALYSVADACLLTSTRDGMNLVSFEYVACQAKKHGVLVLSEFAGAASFMRKGSIPFHPANKTEMSEALYNALVLDQAERTRKYEFLRDFVNTNTRYDRVLVQDELRLIEFVVRNGVGRSSRSSLNAVGDLSSRVLVPVDPVSERSQFVAQVDIVVNATYTSWVENGVVALSSSSLAMRSFSLETWRLVSTERDNTKSCRI